MILLNEIEYIHINLVIRAEKGKFWLLNNKNCGLGVKILFLKNNLRRVSF